MTERLSSFVLAFLAVLIVSKITFKKKVNTATNDENKPVIQSGSYGIAVEKGSD